MLLESRDCIDCHFSLVILLKHLDDLMRRRGRCHCTTEAVVMMQSFLPLKSGCFVTD